MTERHKFIPDVIWIHGDGGWLVPLSRADNPEEWMEICNSDQPIVTQVDDGTPEAGDKGFFPTSSSSAPSIMAKMLDALDVKPGMRVLEIGTGTGYNAALLADIIGMSNVTTIELDRQIAEHAKKSLWKNDYRITPIVGDGALGYPENAPYDRLTVPP